MLILQSASTLPPGLFARTDGVLDSREFTATEAHGNLYSLTTSGYQFGVSTTNGRLCSPVSTLFKPLPLFLPHLNNACGLSVA